MKFGVVGVGAVGARAARQLLDAPNLKDLVLFPHLQSASRELVASLGGVTRSARWSPDNASGLDTVVIATPRNHQSIAEDCLELGVNVVSVSSDLDEVEALLSLDEVARKKNLSIVAGAGFMPGFSCVLARHAADRFDEVDEIHVAKFGTGGPDCARQHHRALRSTARDWRDGVFVERPGGSGRELCWFPDPIGGKDCYRGELPDAVLLQPAFPNASRITARMAATRRDRLTSGLPMLRAPHPEGLLGGIRAEVRGRRDGRHVVEVYGALDRPAVAAGAVAAMMARLVSEGKVERSGVGGLAEMVSDTADFLAAMAERGVKGAVFEGAPPHGAPR